MKRLDENRWMIEPHGKMRVPGIIYASEKMIDNIKSDNAPEQVSNVAHLPGIINYSLAMPDIHWGYGFPIGGVAAFDAEEGIISPGGVGYDINCGVRLLKTDLTRKDLAKKMGELLKALYIQIPSGVGSARKDLILDIKEMKKVAREGASYFLNRGMTDEHELAMVESNGKIKGADPDVVSDRAFQRGHDQLGTLGSGNHFIEINYIDEIYDEVSFKKLGLIPDQLLVSLHTGSRGFGFQICDDFLKVFIKASAKYHIDLPDKQLCCAPIKSEEGAMYIKAMNSAANFAFANRQVISYFVKKVFMEKFKGVKVETIYDLCHNIAKFEKHIVDGNDRLLCVHRKGATRAFPQNHPELPEIYKTTGQPVIIPGDMGRYSYLLLGQENSLKETFGSACHGAGRLMSRHRAIDRARGRNLFKELEIKGIQAMAKGKLTMAEEMPEAYKDVADVVDVMHNTGIAKKVFRYAPLGVIKG